MQSLFWHSTMDAYDVQKIHTFKRLGMKIECSTAFSEYLTIYIQAATMKLCLCKGLRF